jgi:hypothetical protein
VRPNLVAAPASDASPELLVDWLELVSFFDVYKRARVDEITGSLKTQEEVPPENFGDADRDDDLMREAIENEVNTRKKALKEAYPFDLDGLGEELHLLQSIDTPRAAFYLLCLIASHVTKSPILREPPNDDMVCRMRNRVFQVLGTLAVAGFVQGPAVSVGYPRETKESILDVLARAEKWGIGMIARDKPGVHAIPQAKDGGIDVIGWPQADRPPPPHVYFGQLASGNNWRGKPANLEYDNFMDDFFDGRGGAQHNFVTLIPFRVIDALTFDRESKLHKAIFDRHRAPLHALRALDLFANGVEMDEAGNVDQIVAWLVDYRTVALRELAPAA